MPTRFSPLSLALLVSFSCLRPAPVDAHPAAAEMAVAASRLLTSLTPEQRAKTLFDFKADERQNWHYIPKERKGLTLQEMSPDQRQLAHALLRSGLSPHGYEKSTNIMSLEPILFELEGAARKFPRDPLLYHFLIFGSPDPKGTWGWRMEGHHLSANFTVVKGEFCAVTPSFFGTNPAEVRQGPRQGLRVLGAEEDLGRELMKSLPDSQRQAALISATPPKDIFTEARRRVAPLASAGVPASELTRAQRRLLKRLIEEYVRRVRPDLARDDLGKIEKAGFKLIHFAWAGGIEKGEGHYYRVQGPTFLLEYDNTQNNNNHVHAVWRDFENDFGEDLLRRHYEQDPHGR